MSEIRYGGEFVTKGRLVAGHTESPRGRLLVAGCRSGTPLASQIVAGYQEHLAKAGVEEEVLFLPEVDFQFSDDETCARLERDVSGHDVFLVQALYDPTVGRSLDENYVAFLVAARTLREWGANHVTAVLPYLAYARQDKPSQFKREPTTAKFMADLSITAGIDRLVTWQPHSPQIHGFYDSVPVDRLESLHLFVEAYRRFQGRDDVIAVAPDAGASRLITYFARALNLNSAIASKHRPRPGEAVVTEVIGDFAGKRTAIVLDDMISSGGTMEALIKELVDDQAIEEVYVGVSHNLCQDAAAERLRELHDNYHLQELMVTNSVPQTDRYRAWPFVKVRDLADVLGRVINRIHHNRPVSELFYDASDDIQVKKGDD